MLRDMIRFGKDAFDHVEDKDMTIGALIQKMGLGDWFRDYYLLPWLDLGQIAAMRMGEENGIALDAYRTDDLDPLYHMLRRHPIGRAA